MPLLLIIIPLYLVYYTSNHESNSQIYKVPCCTITTNYSVPVGKPVEAICCTSDNNNDLIKLKEFTSINNKIQKLETNNKENINYQCTIVDNISTIDRLNINSPVSSCRILVGSFEHVPCSCVFNASCSRSPELFCNCPGYPNNEPPDNIVSFRNPQDTIRSQPEQGSTTSTQCTRRL